MGEASGGGRLGLREEPVRDARDERASRDGRRRARRDGPGDWRAALADRLPATVRAGALALSPAAVLALAGVAAAAVVVVALLWGVSRPRPVAVPPRVEQSAAPLSAPGPAAGTGGSAAAVVVVDVAGRVRRPGLVELPGGARVADAIEVAGGTTPGADLRSLNLARRLVDGEQVLVLGKGEAPPAAALPPVGGAPVPGRAGAGVAAGGGQLDLNAATVEQFDTLPGVGPVLAQRLIDWRTANGRFSAVEELREVDGIGESRFAELRDLVRVG
ncbi:DNA-binding protein [Motilibacter sp. K478]|nr:DNA-binding protein [Motilibacter aurantiacus]